MEGCRDKPGLARTVKLLPGHDGYLQKGTRAVALAPTLPRTYIEGGWQDVGLKRLYLGLSGQRRISAKLLCLDYSRPIFKQSKYV